MSSQPQDLPGCADCGARMTVDGYSLLSIQHTETCPSREAMYDRLIRGLEHKGDSPC